MGALNLLSRLGEAWLNMRLAWRLLTDGRVPLRNKLILPAVAIYLLWPLDFLPDLLPFLGQVDDLTAVLLALIVFVRSCPRQLVGEHLADIQGRPWRRDPSAGGPDDVVEGQYRVLNDR